MRGIVGTHGLTSLGGPPGMECPGHTVRACVTLRRQAPTALRSGPAVQDVCESPLSHAAVIGTGRRPFRGGSARPRAVPFPVLLLRVSLTTVGIEKLLTWLLVLYLLS